MSLKGRVALITGAGGGIGKAVAVSLAKLGVKTVLFGGKTIEKLNETKKLIDEIGEDCLIISGNLTDDNFLSEGFKKVIEEVGGIDILINNAGMALNCPVEQTPAEVFDKIMGLNVRAPYFLTQLALPYLLKSNRASIINIASVVAHAGYPYQSMDTSIRGTRWLPLLVPAGIAVVLSTAYINAAMVSIFDYARFSSEVVWGSMSDSPAVYELILQFIVMCLVPGVCEEFLFRGAILTNLRPFGRSNAILISAFLFSMMHQNAEQLLYTFAAGIVLGLIYEMTGSIWCTTVLHILNNFVSVTESAIFYRFDDVMTSSLAIVIFEMVLIAIGVISAAILVSRFFSKRTDLRDGIFGRSLPASDGYAECPIEASRARRLFFTPTMIIFLILCLVQVLFLILMAVIYVG
jgi:NAD(P)-dependent dehydrogenase (short-subunit alcohol dehydrogenase family)/energy-converting hydrogenase Eha subunit E